MTDNVQVSWLTVSGLFLITLATLMDEILLTRIFSVTTWYHFAFGAISLAMFGMTVGALRVYQHSQIFAPATVKQAMAESSLWFAATAIGSVITHLLVPFASQPVIAFLWIALSYCLFAVPFYFGGICVCLALTKFPQRAGLLYAADLVGAGTGCIVLVALLKFVDGPTAVLVVGFVGCLASIIFAFDGKLHRMSRNVALIGAALVLTILVSGRLAAKQSPLLRVTWAKGKAEPKPLYEKWNSFSRIAVDGDPKIATPVITEGISQTYPIDRTVLQLHLRIDGGAETTITSWRKPEDLDYLRYDVKNIVHHVQSNGSVLIIGAGGGRDVLSALLMGQRTIRAVEINQNILGTLNSKFGDFSGHLDRNPRIIFVNDEARSYIARTNERFDVIEASFIDTWAATAAGALTLTENSLYTVEAWKLFLNRLSPGGILSFSRWYSPGFPGETYRLVSLASTALRSEGIDDPRGHIVLVSNVRPDIGSGRLGAATILVGKEPFSAKDLDSLEALSRQMQFNVILSPRTASDSIILALANGDLHASAVKSVPLNLSPPTDDCPFFFHIKPLRYAFRDATPNQNGTVAVELQSGEIVIVLLALVIFLTAMFVIVPLFRGMETETIPASMPYLFFFAAIGMGFMLVEVSQMQRLIIFLGHPTYALSVVLSALLVFSGIGSYSTRRTRQLGKDGAVRLVLLLLALLAFGLFSVPVVGVFAGSTTLIRITMAIAMLFPAGFFMGMAFPLGLKLATGKLDALLPAFWGMNGAASICASILAMLIAMNVGISAAFWSGFCCYVVAFCAYLWALFVQRSSQPTQMLAHGSASSSFTA